ncbi:MAG TPA: SDR family oxidoreductase [Mycobacteriales bacterium]|nr:SDR family oxidoreductase [Mycobacteriales bacterium]
MPMQRGTVFVTGASSGIGRATAERLARDGFDVIPGMRRDEPLPAPVQPPVLIDLADPESIGPACKQVLERANGRLVGVVNNAGINVNGPFETVAVERWREQFEVNLFGHIAVTQALLDALFANHGRIVNVGSIGGRHASPMLAPYNASKFAVHGWTDSMRNELAPHGVKVILVEPGSIATAMWDKGISAAETHLSDNLTDEQKQRYGKQAERAMRTARFAASHAVPADRVAKVIERALTARRPRGRYLVGPDARVQAAIAVAPTPVFDRLTKLVVG